MADVRTIVRVMYLLPTLSHKQLFSLPTLIQLPLFNHAFFPNFKVTIYFFKKLTNSRKSHLHTITRRQFQKIKNKTNSEKDHLVKPKIRV